MIRKISKLKLNHFLANLQNDYQVYIPVKKEEIFEFELLQDDSIFNILESSYTSFKKLIIPPVDEIFEFSENEYFKPAMPTKKVVIGMSASDIRALNELKEILAKPVEDSRFFDHISQTTFVATVKAEIQSKKIITEEVEIGYDLLMIQAGDDYYFEPVNEKGQKIISNIRMERVDFDLQKTAYGEFAFFENMEGIAKAIEKSQGSAIWKDLAKICLGCGNCTDVCPLCYCFDTKDKYGPEKIGCGKRCRIWDSCFYKKFDQISGHNFRENLEDRIYHYFHHKFVQAYRERGEFNCNHCGRCIITCPVDINIFKVLEDVMTKFGEVNENEK